PPKPEAPAKPTRSALDIAGFRARLSERPAPPPGPAAPSAESDDTPAMHPLIAVIGVLVLVNAAGAIHPGLAVLVFLAALIIGGRRLYRRWKRRRGR
ncbi:RNA-directed DNA polymerase, partial [Methylopila musalis]